MTDRDVTVQVSMKASQLQASRLAAEALLEFPEFIKGHLDDIAAILTKEQAEPGDAAKLATLMRSAMEACGTAAAFKQSLFPIVQTATISDPDGRQGRLQ